MQAIQIDSVERNCSIETLIKIRKQLDSLKNLTSRTLPFEHTIDLGADGFIRIIGNLDDLKELDSKIKYEFGKFNAEGVRYNELFQSYVLVVRWWLVENHLSGKGE